MGFDSIRLSGRNYEASLDAATGKLVSYRSFGAEMLSPWAGEQPLMELRAVDRETGGFLCFTEDGASVAVKAGTNCCAITAENFPGFPGLRVTVTVQAEAEELVYHTSIQNGTLHYLDNIACPIVQAPGVFTEDGGDTELFWARYEGVVIRRKNHCLPQFVFSLEKGQKLQAVKYYYPGMVTMQHMALMRPEGSLYFAAHDVSGAPKGIAPTLMGEEVRLDLRLYPCAAPGQNWSQPFPIVLKPYRGGWQEACGIYRDFLEAGQFPLPPKVLENKRIPAWTKDSPVFVIYPPRSVRGTGYMGPNEFYPYVNGLKYLDELSSSLQSPLMAYLTYWEGTAPWAPPYAWPPYGGEEAFRTFVEQMHHRGNRVGLYCSGIHWTDKHLLIPEYDMTAVRKEQGLDDAMCRTPTGEFLPGLCSNIRTGTTLCCSRPEAKQILKDQLAGILSADVDYIQLFDQHMGAQAFPCYAKNHDHPVCYGVWASRTMGEIYENLDQQIECTLGPGGSAIGAEGVAADFYCAQMPVSESRGHLGLYIGEPVPAASFVLHEYTSNFMDNMCCFRAAVDRYQNEDTIFYSLAYSFAAGDALTLVMKSGGEIHYDWGQSWLEPGPKQEPVKQFVKQLNGLRRGRLNSWLYGGKMLPTPAFSQPGAYSMTRFDGTVLTIGEVLSSCWRNAAGEEIQIFVNFRNRALAITPSVPFDQILTEEGEYPHPQKTLVVPALSAVAIRI